MFGDVLRAPGTAEATRERRRHLHSAGYGNSPGDWIIRSQARSSATCTRRRRFNDCKAGRESGRYSLFPRESAPVHASNRAARTHTAAPARAPGGDSARDARPVSKLDRREILCHCDLKDWRKPALVVRIVVTATLSNCPETPSMCQGPLASGNRGRHLW